MSPSLFSLVAVKAASFCGGLLKRVRRGCWFPVREEKFSRFPAVCEEIDEDREPLTVCSR